MTKRLNVTIEVIVDELEENRKCLKTVYSRDWYSSVVLDLSSRSTFGSLPETWLSVSGLF